VRKDAHMLGKRLDYQVEENKIHFFFEKEEAFLEVLKRKNL
jgi:alpha-glucosidase